MLNCKNKIYVINVKCIIFYFASYLVTKCFNFVCLYLLEDFELFVMIQFEQEFCFDVIVYFLIIKLSNNLLYCIHNHKIEISSA